MSQYSDLICFTIFAPVELDPVTDFSIRNAHGTGEAPNKVGTGHYRFDCPDETDFKRISITARAFQAAGDFRHVDVLPSHFGPGGTRFDVFIRDEDGNDSDDFVLCEVTVRLLPIA